MTKDGGSDEMDWKLKVNGPPCLMSSRFKSLRRYYVSFSITTIQIVELDQAHQFVWIASSVKIEGGKTNDAYSFHSPENREFGASATQ
jgi:hypothetical protein